MDADVGVNVLEFSYMKGHIAHAGFPEISYGVMAERLVQAGYKVARVEQTETPEMLKVRKKNKKHGAPTPQVVNREVCSVLTRGTRTFCYLDKELATTSTDSSVGPLLAIREVLLPQSTQVGEQVQPVCEYGVTIVDAVRATVTIGQFQDDVLRSRMNTLLATFEPSEVCFYLFCQSQRANNADPLVSFRLSSREEGTAHRRYWFRF
jgi:DNA mismatch repair protein MSH6